MLVIKNLEICPGVWNMTLYSPRVAKAAAPGQFLHIRCSTSSAPLLRRPISIAGVHREVGNVEIVYKVVGEGTQWLSEIGTSEELDVLGPLGKGFPHPEQIDESAKPILVGGGLGVAPLLSLAQSIAKSRHTSPPGEFYAGFGTEYQVYGLEMLESLGFDIFVTTDDGSMGYQGYPTELLTDIEPDTILYACGPEPLLKAVKALGKSKDIATYISLEEHMACGIGSCMGCSVESARGGYLKVCKDGPVFEAGQVILKGEDRT